MKKLELLFENEAGKTVTYSLDQPIEPVDQSAVSNAMDTIVSADVFNTSGGRIVAKKSARLVERTVDEIEIDAE